MTRKPELVAEALLERYDAPRPGETLVDAGIRLVDEMQDEHERRLLAEHALRLAQRQMLAEDRP
jgi:hypothetical protein